MFVMHKSQRIRGVGLGKDLRSKYFIALDLLDPQAARSTNCAQILSGGVDSIGKLQNLKGVSDYSSSLPLCFFCLLREQVITGV